VSSCRIVAAGALTVALLASPVAASASALDDLPQPSQADLAASVRDIDLRVSDIQPRVEDVETTATEGDETVVSLRSDILFAFGRAELPTAAAAKIKTLLTSVPRGARLRVYGHTDSVGDDARNQTLSRARAAAVAAVVRRARPDLTLDVRGFGESRPVQPNTLGGKDNPEGRAANRRVELRYAS
jgi:outer membrane protein OmpA-like peptidoglycan-associated protein